MLSSVKNKAEIIVVDLDGTLVFTDTLGESALQLVRDDAIRALHLPFWLLEGKALFKQRLADAVELDPAILPYNEPLINWLKQQKALNHKLVLCTATNISVAKRIAYYLELFDEVIASDNKNNLAGINKKATLDEAYGEGQYIYAGNSDDDIQVWNGASKGVVVNASPRVFKKAKAMTEIHSHFPRLPITLPVWHRVFRFHQWLKNLLLFVPLLAAHRVNEVHSLTQLFLAFFSFSLCASAVYITNDLLDLESDRRHPRKKYRPFACGCVPLSYGLLLAPVCASASLAISAQVGTPFTAWLLIYFGLTFAYSVKLKKLVLIDCLTLAALYTLRIVAGAAAVSVPLSFWLLAFSIFIFLSLAFVKRYAELQVQSIEGKQTAPGRGYFVTDASFIQTLGITSGYAGVLVLALYLHDQTTSSHYHAPEFLWGAVPLMLFWISWVWLKAHRGLMTDDPLVFAIKDKASWAILLGIGISFAVATLTY